VTSASWGARLLVAVLVRFRARPPSLADDESTLEAPWDPAPGTRPPRVSHPWCGPSLQVADAGSTSPRSGRVGFPRRFGTARQRLQRVLDPHVTRDDPDGNALRKPLIRRLVAAHVDSWANRELPEGSPVAGSFPWFGRFFRRPTDARGLAGGSLARRSISLIQIEVDRVTCEGPGSEP
jgi:hypothetical protein